MLNRRVSRPVFYGQCPRAYVLSPPCDGKRFSMRGAEPNILACCRVACAALGGVEQCGSFAQSSARGVAVASTAITLVRGRAPVFCCVPPSRHTCKIEDRVNIGEDPVVLTRIQHNHHVELVHSSMGMEELGHHVYKVQSSCQQQRYHTLCCLQAHPLQLHEGNRMSKQQLNQGMSSDFRSQYRSANTTADNSSYLYNG
ncbi:hypothetical protein PR048_028849 [Dryococelus australis]|uniref:Uncharacterized protein n=1 Tax=Dryococelus australis TaxID=614101 RepID=A0ABQ9GBQ1_9NEOP|nr:hypothetical protein PR048_028849 [Dryococelus australis]